jgi:hypothetical protein
MKTCEETRQAVVLQEVGELEDGLDLSFRAHLIDCAECAAEAGRLRAVLQKIRGGEVPDPGAVYWAAFGQRVRARIVRTRAGGRRPMFLGIAAAALAALGLGLFAARHGVWPAPGAGARAGGTAATRPAADDGSGGGAIPAVDTAEARLEAAIRRAAEETSGQTSFEAVLDDVIPVDPLVMDGDSDLPEAVVPAAPGTC